MKCSLCDGPIVSGQEREHRGKILCEDCYLETRIPYARKTHWQYIRSIKTRYLIPAKKRRK